MAVPQPPYRRGLVAIDDRVGYVLRGWVEGVG